MAPHIGKDPAHAGMNPANGIEFAYASLPSPPKELADTRPATAETTSPGDVMPDKHDDLIEKGLNPYENPLELMKGGAPAD